MSIKLIERIEAKLQGEAHLDDASRRELLALLDSLKSEMRQLAAAHGDHAESIAGFAGAATHEATRLERNPDLVKLALEGLSASVKDMEAEYPRLVSIVNGICSMLSNMGI